MASVSYDDNGCPCDSQGRVHGLSAVLHVNSKQLVVVALASDTVLKLKERIAKEAKESGCTVNNINLILNGKPLDDTKMLYEENVHLDANGDFDGANDRLELEMSQQTSAASTFSVQLKSITGNVTTIGGVSLGMTVDALKLKYAQSGSNAPPVALFGLIAKAKKWPDAATLADFSVVAGDLIHVMNRTEAQAATWGEAPPPQKKRACLVM
jgi:hypothetical protein